MGFYRDKTGKVRKRRTLDTSQAQSAKMRFGPRSVRMMFALGMTTAQVAEAFGLKRSALAAVLNRSSTAYRKEISEAAKEGRRERDQNPEAKRRYLAACKNVNALIDLDQREVATLGKAEAFALSKKADLVRQQRREAIAKRNE